jgi:hypothetical protein
VDEGQRLHASRYRGVHGARNTNRVLAVFKRVHIAQRLLIEQLTLLESMSPKEYRTIRLGLGVG